MWNLKAFVVLIGALWVSGVAESFKIPDETETEILSQALVRIAKEIIAPINQTVNIVTCNGAGNRLDNLPKYLMKDLNNSMTFTNELRTEIENLYDELRNYKSALLVICDKWNIALDEEKNMDGAFNTEVGHIAYISVAAAKQYIKTIYGFDKKIYSKSLLLVDDGDYLKLKIVSFVSEKTCTKAHLRTINRFSKRRRQWEAPFNLKALRNNNHGCTFELMIDAQPPEIIWPQNQELKANFSLFSGYFVDITKDLSVSHNFKTSVNYESKNIDIILFGYSREGDALIYSKSTDMISIHREIIFVIPLGDFYSGFEKLFLPFDVATWILIAMTFAIGLLTILIVTQLSMYIQSFVIGRDVSAPTMNLLAAFFGLGQTRLPARNFARFLLMLYILWCLIIRTGYQGVLYDLLKGDGRRAQNMQLDDFITRNATFHVDKFCYQAVVYRQPFMKYCY